MIGLVTGNSDSQADLHSVYRERLLSLFRHPVGIGDPDPDARRGWAKNRTCGDEVTFYSLGSGEMIDRCWQDTAGCAISTATASLLVNALAGKSRDEGIHLLRLVREMVYEGKEIDLPDELPILSAVHYLPSRHECVGVALRAALQSLESEEESR